MGGAMPGQKRHRPVAQASDGYRPRWRSERGVERHLRRVVQEPVETRSPDNGDLRRVHGNYEAAAGERDEEPEPDDPLPDAPDLEPLERSEDEPEPDPDEPDPDPDEPDPDDPDPDPDEPDPDEPDPDDSDPDPDDPPELDDSEDAPARDPELELRLSVL
jgi:peptidoglycan DL-endopeptidase CwlO